MQKFPRIARRVPRKREANRYNRGGRTRPERIEIDRSIDHWRAFQCIRLDAPRPSPGDPSCLFFSFLVACPHLSLLVALTEASRLGCPLREGSTTLAFAHIRSCFCFSFCFLFVLFFLFFNRSNPLAGRLPGRDAQRTSRDGCESQRRTGSDGKHCCYRELPRDRRVRVPRGCKRCCCCCCLPGA